MVVHTQILLPTAEHKKKKLVDNLVTQMALVWIRQEQIHKPQSLSKSPKRPGSRWWSFALVGPHGDLVYRSHTQCHHLYCPGLGWPAP